MRSTALFAALMVALGCCAPVAADDSRLEKEVQELRARLELLEKELAASKKASQEKPKDPPAGKSGASASKTRFEYNGYIESRFTNYSNSRGEERTAGPEFQISRLRTRLNFIPEDHWLVSLEVNAGTRSSSRAAVDMREFYFQYLKNNNLVRVGQQRVPFGFQVGAESSRDRAALERARVFNILFPNERDLGVILSHNNHINNPDISNSGYKRNKPRYVIGVMNGDGINRNDGNKDKSFAGNVVVPVGQHQFGASFYVGSTTVDILEAPVSDPTKRAVGIEHRFDSQRFHTQLEYVLGELFGNPIHGGLLQFLYNTGQPGNVFLRVDIFDPDANDSGNSWRRASIGWYRDFTKSFRVTAQYDFLRARGTEYKNTWGLEAQLRF